MVDYKLLNQEAKSLLSDINYEISLLANASSLLNMHLKNINWVGFYLYKNNELILGPFQGLVACTNIVLGKGVCGFSALKKESVVVKNVHEFPGHIACDANSNSEIVIPIIVNNKLYGVLDIDSYLLDNFNEYDKTNLEEFVSILSEMLESLTN